MWEAELECLLYKILCFGGIKFKVENVDYILSQTERRFCRWVGVLPLSVLIIKPAFNFLVSMTSYQV